MAEKKKKKVVTTDGTELHATPQGNAGGLRIGAVILWLVAIAFEVGAILFFKEKLTFLSQTTGLIVCLVADLIAVIIGSLLWKKSNTIDPASKSSPVKFWLWNNLGVIMSVVAFAPFIVLTLTDKKADKKTKTIGVVVAAVALLIAGASSVEYNPQSKEDYETKGIELTEDQVCWTKSGTVYHSSIDCSHLNQSEEVIVGSVEEANEAGKERLCKDCEKRDAKAEEGETTEVEKLTENTEAENEAA